MSSDIDKLTKAIYDICTKVIEATQDEDIYFYPHGIKTQTDMFDVQTVTIEFSMYTKDLFSDIKGTTDE